MVYNFIWNEIILNKKIIINWYENNVIKKTLNFQFYDSYFYYTVTSNILYQINNNIRGS